MSIGRSSRVLKMYPLILLIKKLEAHREAKTAVGELSYFKELHTKDNDPKKEFIQDFLLSFNNMIVKAEEVDHETWSDSRKKKIFLSAIKETHPELVLIDRAQEGRLTFEKAQQMYKKYRNMELQKKICSSVFAMSSK